MAAEVILPVYNGYEALVRCLDALSRHTPARHPVHVVDDASTDARVLPLLRDFAARRAGTKLHENESNQGFVGAVNRALAETSGDVVILNADTEVTAGWIEGLERCRDSAASIAIVCPLSNNATLLTVPALASLAGGADAIAACVRDAGPPSYPRIPTAVGFCMLVTRQLLDAAGPLDPAYGRGYGEENDLSMRALDLGFEIACADDVYVHHAGEVSFGTVAGLDAAREDNRLRLERRWPAYAPGVSTWMRTNPLRATVERVNARCEREGFPGRPRVLHVMHAFDSHGGVEQHTRAMVEALREDVAFNVIVPRGFSGAWADLAQERPVPHLRVSRFNRDLFTPGVHVLEFRANVRDAVVESMFERFLEGVYDVVHFHSPVSWNSMALPRLAREAGARVVLSVHDMSWMCADYNMVGRDARPCGRSVARGTDAGCVECLRPRSFTVGTPMGGIEDFIEERYAAARDAVAHADAIVCPSRFMADRMTAAFGEEAARAVRIVRHGVQALPRMYRAAERPVLAVASLGRFSPQKGALVYIEAARRLDGQGIVFEAWGAVDERLRETARAAGVALRGPYAIGELPQHLRAVDLVVIPTPLEESFCLTLAEAQALGIPVAAARIGAIPERIRHGENGFLFEPGDSAALARLLLELRDDRTKLARVAARLADEPPKTVAQNAAEYLELYRELAAQPRTRARRVHAPTPPAASFLRMPRERRRTPLGGDDYDRWLAAETPDTVDAQAAPCVIELPQVDAEALDAMAINRAIAASEPEWVVIAQAGDRLAPHALASLMGAAQAHPRAVLVYADEDAISARGERYDPSFKPAFSPELLRHRPYIAGLCALRRERVLALGGLRAPGWLGIVELALRLAAENDPALVAHADGILVHRLDSNLACLERTEFRRRMNEIVSDALRRAGAQPVRIAAAGGAPAMWAYRAPGDSPITIFVRCDGAMAEAVACVDAVMPTLGRRLGQIVMDAPLEQAGALIETLRRHGASAVVHAVRSRGGEALAEVLRGAKHEWIAVIDARCRGFAAGWLERLEQGIAGPFVACIAPDVSGANGEHISGAWVLGGGPWSVAGAMPLAQGNDALASLHGQPREVSCTAPWLSLWRRDAVNAPGVTSALVYAGRYDVVHLALEVGARGYDVLSRPFIAAQCAAASRTPARELTVESGVPADVGWMRARWAAKLEHDPRYHAALALTAPKLRVAERFTPRVEGRVRVCAFPFDRWGSGELRVRQPCAALERAGHADVALMDTHEHGYAPNALEWRRLGADTLLAHNFFHDYQIAALHEYRRHGEALRVLGMDDLLTQIPAGNPYAATIYPDIAKRVAHAKSLCDRLVVSTDALAEAYGDRIDVHVIPNALSEAAWAALENRPRDGDRPRVGWAGARQHLDDLAVIAPLVERTHRDIDWVFLGMCPPALRRYAAEFHDMVPIADYPRKLASLGLDAAVAPLADHPFNRAKSDLKVLEYGVLGIPVIASDIAPYRATPALLVRDADAWMDAVLALARDRGGARQRGLDLRQWVLTHRMLASMLSHWRRALNRER